MSMLDRSFTEYRQVILHPNKWKWSALPMDFADDIEVLMKSRETRHFCTCFLVVCQQGFVYVLQQYCGMIIRCENDIKTFLNFIC